MLTVTIIILCPILLFHSILALAKASAGEAKPNLLFQGCFEASKAKIVFQNFNFQVKFSVGKSKFEAIFKSSSVPPPAKVSGCSPDEHDKLVGKIIKIVSKYIK